MYISPALASRSSKFYGGRLRSRARSYSYRYTALRERSRERGGGRGPHPWSACRDPGEFLTRITFDFAQMRRTTQATPLAARHRPAHRTAHTRAHAHTHSTHGTQYTRCTRENPALLRCPAASTATAHAAASAAAYVKAKTFSLVSQRVPKLWLGKPLFSRCILLTLRGSE